MPAAMSMPFATFSLLKYFLMLSLMFVSPFKRISGNG
jgi:hypothetical protein